MAQWFRTGAVHLGVTNTAGWVANPTLLQPGGWKWIVHYAATPYHSYFPFAVGKAIPAAAVNPTGWPG